MNKHPHPINVLATALGLSLTEENYRAAIELLEQRFGDKQVIISLATWQVY